ncbi:MAG: hypothetical protein N4J56_008061 [Chroococcidiopsis sp. SAG 2025]|nr:hypothetical protein [Chroococcidiopsis sp. SAG 2025]MDV2998356.1 hypothetical protein [Chroococcidiopsis sp. SAG 2025]
MVVDSTGVKVYGEGEWKTRQHGVSKRRTWRKLHLGVDEATGEILAAVVSTNDVADCEVMPELLDAIAQEIEQVSADGAYDTQGCYDVIEQREATAAIPPRRNAKIWGSVVDVLLIDLKHWLQGEFGAYLNTSTTLP